MTGGGSVALGGSTTLGLENCGANQVLEFVGSAWTCASAGTGTITGVTAGTDLTGGGTSGIPNTVTTAHRWEGSRPRDPFLSKPSTRSNHRRKYTLGFWHILAARGDARPPEYGDHRPSLGGIASPRSVLIEAEHAF